jgi:hypothetical protein
VGERGEGNFAALFLLRACLKIGFASGSKSVIVRADSTIENAA